MNLSDRLLAAADHCVLCGICLPHCPTFQLRGQEVESPRGRISLLAAFASGALERSPALLKHIDSCLACRSCEKNCPSGVRYGEIISSGRALLQLEQPPQADLYQRLEERLFEGGGALAQLTRLAGNSGVAGLAGRSGLLGKGKLAHLSRLLPTDNSSAPLTDEVPAVGEQRGVVALFVGCTGRLFERATLHAAAQLLSHCGWRVLLPATPHCCGSRALSHGEVEQARSQRKATLALFAGLLDQGVEQILTLSSACGGLMAQIDQWQEASPISQRVAAQVEDTVEFLLADARFTELKFTPASGPVALHTPCSATNLLGKGHNIPALLARIKGLELRPLPRRYSCCGAAGDYLLDHPETAAELRAPLLEALRESPCATLVTSNISCALHLGEGVRDLDNPCEVVHPLVLLARQLDANPKLG